MSISNIILDGYTLPYNPPVSKNPEVKSAIRTKTLGGNYFSDWGMFQSDRDIELNWDLMEKTVYDVLVTKFRIRGTLSYTDEYGTVFTIIVKDVSFDTLLEGGAPYYRGVKLKAFVVSQP